MLSHLDSSLPEPEKKEGLWILALAALVNVSSLIYVHGDCLRSSHSGCLKILMRDFPVEKSRALRAHLFRAEIAAVACLTHPIT
jgi:hypothetical protein